MKLLDRYLARELVWPFLTGVAAFSAILLGTNILFQLVKLATSGVPLGIVLRLFTLGLPAIVVLTFPMAMLFSSLMAFGRLSSQSELVAMLSSGVNLYRMLVPIFAIALVVTGVTWEFNEHVVPWSTRSATDLKAAVGQAVAETHIVLPQYANNRRKAMVWADRYDPVKQELLGVIYFELDKNGEIVVSLNAPEARYKPDIGQWDFYNCTVQRIDAGGSRSGKVAKITYNIGKDPQDIQKSKVNPDQVTYAELQKHIAQERKLGNPTDEDEVNLNRKLALPFTSLVFAAVGVPLGIRPSRRSSGFGLGLGFSVLIIFVFYVLSNYLIVIGGKGVISPVLAAWLPNLIALASGIMLLARAPK